MLAGELHQTKQNKWIRITSARTKTSGNQKSQKSNADVLGLGVRRGMDLGGGGGHELTCTSCGLSIPK